MINLVVKNGDNGRLLLLYSKGDSVPFSLLTIDDLGLPKIATSDSRRSYAIIDSIRKIMRDENACEVNIDISVDDSYTHSTNSDNLNTLFKYLNRDLDSICIMDKKIVFGFRKTA